MTMMPFHVLFPDKAKNECRTITPFNNERLPSRPFLLMEFFCVEPRCDCRRVILNVVDTETREQVATINHAFEPPKPPFDDEGQTFLDPINPQSALSDALFEILNDLIANDAGYRERLEQHYTLWKAVVDNPSHPDHAKVRSELHDSADFKPAFPRQETVQREGPKVGPNEPCHCGSGRKYKRCCWQ